ncbi:MAG: hypothetical protein H9W81_13515 [Enterococcus sp.]|nr:hypothetical protein [Enterococcus sp.]
MAKYLVEVSSGANSMVVETSNGEHEFNHQLKMSGPGDVVTLYRVEGTSEIIVREGYGA